MNKLLHFLFAFLLALPCSYAQQITFDQPERGFTSWQPAENWEHSLLTGNGTMGAMVTGQPYDETIILSHEALYLPQKRSGKVFDQQQDLQKIKSLLLAGNYTAAAGVPESLRKEQGFNDQRDPFIPAFDLRINQQPANIRQYQRAVNFETGEASVDWTDDQGQYSRKVFVSRADSVIVLTIKGNRKINCTLHFEQRPVSWDQWGFVKDGVKQMHSSADDNYLIFNSEFNYKYPGGLTGYAGVGRLVLQGGTSQVKNGELVISGADEVTLLVKIKPGYSLSEGLADQLKHELSELKSTSGSLYTSLLARHILIHGTLFRKMKLDLDGTAEERKLNSESLIQRGNSIVSHALIEKVFDAGRYNILSATGTSAPNLQGIWSGTWTGPWSAGFTTDGNLPTAISILLPGNLPELMNGFFNYHEKLMDQYRKEARQLYGARGIHVPAQITTRGVETDFGATWCLTYWTGAAGWTANFFNDYYLYTGDKTFLKTRAYPFMKEAALFYEDFLHTGVNGKLLFIPSYSPENNPANSKSQAVINSTMDVMIAKQLLRNCITAAGVLGTDPDKIALWKKMLGQMPAYEVNSDGALREWLWPGLLDNYNHRHASQLYALYDGIDADFESDTALLKAAQVLISKKLDFRKAEDGGEMAFGLVQLGISAAHVGNAAQAEQILNWLSSKYWTKGLGSYHNVKGLFNTDISGGLPYLVTQLLCNSSPGVISLLPALPANWKKGKIEGMLLRGQITMNSLAWNEEKISLILTSALNQQVVIRWKNAVQKVDLKAGESKSYSFNR